MVRQVPVALAMRYLTYCRKLQFEAGDTRGTFLSRNLARVTATATDTADHYGLSVSYLEVDCFVQIRPEQLGVPGNASGQMSCYLGIPPAAMISIVCDHFLRAEAVCPLHPQELVVYLITW